MTSLRPARGLVRLDGGLIGYATDPDRTDDCLQVAVATALQVPPGQLPDSRLDDRLAAGETPEEISRSAWAQLEEWLIHRGLQLVHHEQVPVARDLWIGVCVVDPGDRIPCEVPVCFPAPSPTASRTVIERRP